LNLGRIIELEQRCSICFRTRSLLLWFNPPNPTKMCLKYSKIESINPGQIRLQNGHFRVSAMVFSLRSKIMPSLTVLERFWGKKSSKIGHIFTIYRFFLFQEQASHGIVKGDLLKLKGMGKRLHLKASNSER
jgi:hypothetical protein